MVTAIPIMVKTMNKGELKQKSEVRRGLILHFCPHCAADSWSDAVELVQMPQLSHLQQGDNHTNQQALNTLRCKR